MINTISERFHRIHLPPLAPLAPLENVSWLVQLMEVLLSPNSVRAQSHTMLMHVHPTRFSAGAGAYGVSEVESALRKQPNDRLHRDTQAITNWLEQQVDVC